MAITSGLVAVLLGAAGFLAGRVTAPRAPLPEAAPAQVRPTTLPSPTEPAPRVLARADLIALARRATDAFVSGQTGPAEATAGQRFDLALPLGCGMPAAGGEDGPLRWTYDDAAGVLRITISPTRWSAADWGLPEGASGAEGYWLGRPWSSAETCPRAAGRPIPAGAASITLPGQTLAVAEFPADPQTEAAARPLEIVRRVAPDRLDLSQGLQLHVSGRLQEVPGAGGKVVQCVQPGGIDQRPACVIAVRLDEVRLANGASADVLATWPVSRAR